MPNAAGRLLVVVAAALGFVELFVEFLAVSAILSFSVCCVIGAVHWLYVKSTEGWPGDL